MLRLLKLSLRNFKGIRDFTFEPGGGNATVYGQNETGKTTLFDAFTWLLFNKDSSNQANFEIKTFDHQTGETLHNLEHEVEAVLDVGGKTLTLKKIYHEVWTKKRGSIEKTFSGHTTDHFVDGVPVNKTKYDARINELIDEDLFRLLTNPTYFNEQLHWQQRRALLLEICGDLTDGEVIASDKALARLSDILGGRKVEDHKKVIKARMAAINKELDKLPVRIDEVQRRLPDLSTLEASREELERELASLRQQQRQKERELAQLGAGGAVAELVVKLRDVEDQLRQLKREHAAAVEGRVRRQQQQLNRYADEEARLKTEQHGKQRDLEDRRGTVERLQARLERLREQWEAIDAEELQYTPELVCLTCGQDLPEDQVEAARETALRAFNTAKAERIKENEVEGQATKQRLAVAQAERETLEQEINTIESRLVDLETISRELTTEVKELEGEVGDYTTTAEYRRLTREKVQLEQQIAQLQEDATAPRTELEARIAALETAIGAVQRDIALYDQYTRDQARIAELEAEQRKLAAEHERLAEELHLTEEFTRAKVRLLHDRINSKFKLARFKLFKDYIEGGLDDWCETLYKGVPYGTNLNSGHRTCVGLDIINTLAEHYKVTAPIFVDNAESVTQLPETRSQLIRLVHDPGETELRVEYESETSTVREAV